MDFPSPSKCVAEYRRSGSCGKAAIALGIGISELSGILKSQGITLQAGRIRKLSEPQWEQAINEAESIASKWGVSLRSIANRSLRSKRLSRNGCAA